MSLKDKIKEMKISNIDADIDLLYKRKKHCKFFVSFHLLIQIIYIGAILFSMIFLLKVSLIENPTLHLITLLVALGTAIIFLILFSLREYITMLDEEKDIQYYEMFIYLKKKLGDK